jgi:surface polysaccharide O-acyltransferase-like enzyme
VPLKSISAIYLGALQSVGVRSLLRRFIASLLKAHAWISMSPEKNVDPERAGNGESTSLPVDLIRVVAVVLVILLHASIESYTNVMLDAAQSRMYWWTTTIFDSLARVCVPLFVMLSGFLLLQPIKVHEPIRVFLKKRFTRLGLAFGFWSAIYFAWSFYVHNQALSVTYVIQGLLTGPYYHFWYIYLIAGLYIITPILRVIITYGDRKILKYIIAVWFVGVSVVPLFQLLTGFTVEPNLILVAGWIGYFVFGAYLQRVHVRDRKSVV